MSILPNVVGMQNYGTAAATPPWTPSTETRQPTVRLPALRLLPSIYHPPRLGLPALRLLPSIYHPRRLGQRVNKRRGLAEQDDDESVNMYVLRLLCFFFPRF